MMHLPDFSNITAKAEEALNKGFSGIPESFSVVGNENYGVKKNFFRQRKIYLPAKKGPTEKKVRKHSFRRLFGIALKSRARQRMEKLASKRKGKNGEKPQATVYSSLYSETFGRDGGLSSSGKFYEGNSGHSKTFTEVELSTLQGLKEKPTFSAKSKQICDTINKNLNYLKYLFSVLKKSESLTEDSVKGVLRDFLYKNGVIPSLDTSHLSNYVKINNGDKKYLYISDIAEYLHQHLGEEIKFSPVEVHEDVEISYSNIKYNRSQIKPITAEDEVGFSGWVHANDNDKSIPLPSGVFPEKSNVGSGDDLQTGKDSGDLGDKLTEENEDLIKLVAGLNGEQSRTKNEAGLGAQEESGSDVDIEGVLSSRGEFMEQLSDAQREDEQKEMYTTFIKRLEEAKDKGAEFKKIMDEVNKLFVFHQIDSSFFVNATADLRKKTIELLEEEERRVVELKKKDSEMAQIEKNMLEDLDNHAINQGESPDADLTEFHLRYMGEILENNERREAKLREKSDPTGDNGELPFKVPRTYRVVEEISAASDISATSPLGHGSPEASEKQERVVVKLDDFLSKYEKFSLLKDALRVNKTFFKSFFNKVVVSDVKNFPCDTLELGGTLYDVSVLKDMNDLTDKIYSRYFIERSQRLNRPKRKK